MRTALLVLGLMAAACASGGSPADDGTGPAPEGCADVVGAELTVRDDGTHDVAATIRSSDTGWDKYADAFEVVAPDGTVLGTRELLHPHVDEQPFTRSLSGIRVPEEVERVTVRARDSVVGFCGEVVERDVPR